MIYIAAPFGNYIHTEKTTSVTGTFTRNPRAGLIFHTLKSLRYSFKDKCWYNSLGLRNPGIVRGVHKPRKDDYLSIAAVEAGDWLALDAYVPQTLPVELNISCPNIDHFDDYARDLHIYVKRNPIVKISAEISEAEIDGLIDMGFARFHCCNTLKTNKGARSGKILREYATKQIRHIRSRNQHIECIAGGGIQSIEDIKYYTSVGANSFSLGTVCFNPFKLRKILVDFFS